MQDKEDGFVDICASFISGVIYRVPPELRVLLTVRPLDPGEVHEDEDVALIGWVPSILQDLLRRTDLKPGHWLNAAKNDMAWMFGRLLDAAPRYQYLFAICYLARCVARRSHGVMVPVPWVEDPDVEVKINPFNSTTAGKTFDMCKAYAIKIRFLCKASPPAETFVDQNGWTVPQGTVLDAFFGESGRYWTPIHWQRLNCSFKEALCLNDNGR